MGAGNHPVDLVVAELGTRQHGVVARWQLLRLGAHRRELARRVDGGRLHRIHRGVYAVGHRRLTREARFIAAVLACGPGALLSHRSAATLHNLRTGGTRIEVLSASRGRPGPPGIVLHSTRGIDPEDRAVIDAIPVTSLARTLVDLAAVVGFQRLGRAFEEAERIRKLDVRAVERVLARAPNRTGTRNVRALLAERRVAPDSREGMEHDLADALRGANLPMPVFNVMIEGYLVDAVWPEHKLIVELDSYSFHDRSRKSFEYERVRHTQLQLRGWTVVRLTSGQVPRVAAVVAELLSAARAA